MISYFGTILSIHSNLENENRKGYVYNVCLLCKDSRCDADSLRSSPLLVNNKLERAPKPDIPTRETQFYPNIRQSRHDPVLSHWAPVTEVLSCQFQLYWHP